MIVMRRPQRWQMISARSWTIAWSVPIEPGPAKFEKWVVRNRNILTTAVLLLFGGLSSIAYLQYQNSREVSGKNDLLSAK